MAAAVGGEAAATPSASTCSRGRPPPLRAISFSSALPVRAAWTVSAAQAEPMACRGSAIC